MSNLHPVFAPIISGWVRSVTPAKFIDWYGIGLQVADGAIDAHGYAPPAATAWAFALDAVEVFPALDLLTDGEREMLTAGVPHVDFRNGYAEGIRLSKVAK